MVVQLMVVYTAVLNLVSSEKMAAIKQCVRAKTMSKTALEEPYSCIAWSDHSGLYPTAAASDPPTGIKMPLDHNCPEQCGVANSP
jgi:hypothetical protein